MNISIMAFIAMASVSVFFMAATAASVSNFKLPPQIHTGDTSLGKQSVNWLGAIAFVGAILICLI
jgi:hypothetical protein